jgi:hypothetical protein
MDEGMTHFHYTLEADQRLIIDFIFTQQPRCRIRSRAGTS